MNRRKLGTLIALFVVLGMLVGCAGPGSPAPQAQPAATSAPAKAAAAPTQPPAAPTSAPAATKAPAAAAATQPAAAVGTGQAPDKLTIAQSADITTLDPDVSSALPEANILNHIFDRLVYTDRSMKVQPMLAESWKMLDDTKTWQFKLRKDVKFWDGEALNANTVKFVFDRAKDPANKFVGNTPGYVFSSLTLDHVDVVDDYTVNIVLKTFQPDAPGYIGEVYIHSVKYYTDNPKEKVAAAPMGSGPYKVKEWLKDDHVTLERWDDYWGTKPTVKTLVWRPIPEASTRVAELLAGSVDVITNVPPDQAPQVDKSDKARMATITGGRRIAIEFSMECTGPGCAEVKDKRVRQAINYAVDVNSILKNLLYGRGERVGTMVNPPNNAPDVKPYPYDPAKAKELLAAAGYPNGFKLTLSTPNGRYIKDKDIALAVGADLAKVGIQAEVVPYEWSVYSGMTSKKQLPAMFLLGAGSQFYSAWYDLSLLVTKESPTNYGNWWNDEWGALVKQLGTTVDTAERRKITDQMQRVTFDDPPWLFLYMQVDWYGVNKKLDWQPSPTERMDFKSVKFAQ